MNRIPKFVFFFSICLLVLPSCAQKQADKPVQVNVHTVQAVPGQDAIMVVLLTEDGKRYLPIFVDQGQGMSIYLGKSEKKASRPLTHDLMVSSLEALGAEVEQIVISDLKDGVYYAELTLKQDRKNVSVDARPSDAIAVALRSHAPIFVMEKLLDEFEQEQAGSLPTTSLTLGRWGITVQPLQGSLAEYFGEGKGLLISDVVPESPAGKQDIRPGDILKKINDENVADFNSVRTAVDKIGGDKKVELLIIRDGEPLKVRLQGEG